LSLPPAQQRAGGSRFQPENPDLRNSPTHRPRVAENIVPGY
jgi:hypothetical protein